MPSFAVVVLVGLAFAFVMGLGIAVGVFLLCVCAGFRLQRRDGGHNGRTNTSGDGSDDYVNSLQEEVVVELKGVPLESKPAKLTEEQQKKKNETIARYKRRRERQERRERRARERLARANIPPPREGDVEIASDDIESVTTLSTRATTVVSSRVAYGRGQYLPLHKANSDWGGAGWISGAASAAGETVRSGISGAVASVTSYVRRRKQRKQHRERRRARGEDVGQIQLFNQWADDIVHAADSSSSSGSDEAAADKFAHDTVDPRTLDDYNKYLAKRSHAENGGDSRHSRARQREEVEAARRGRYGPTDLVEKDEGGGRNDARGSSPSSSDTDSDSSDYMSGRRSVASSAPRPPEDVPGALPERLRERSHHHHRQHHHHQEEEGKSPSPAGQDTHVEALTLPPAAVVAGSTPPLSRNPPQPSKEDEDSVPDENPGNGFSRPDHRADHEPHPRTPASQVSPAFSGTGGWGRSSATATAGAGDSKKRMTGKDVTLNVAMSGFFMNDYPAASPALSPAVNTTAGAAAAAAAPFSSDDD